MFSDPFCFERFQVSVGIPNQSWPRAHAQLRQQGVHERERLLGVCANGWLTYTLYLP